VFPFSNTKADFPSIHAGLQTLGPHRLSAFPANGP